MRRCWTALLWRRWRTALIVRELEDEIAALADGLELRRQLKDLLRKKELVGDLFNQLRLQHTRNAFGRAETAPHFACAEDVRADLTQLLTVMDRLDEAITPLVREDGARFSDRWGYLSIAGVNDKSQIQRQIEKCGPAAAAAAGLGRRGCSLRSLLLCAGAPCCCLCCCLCRGFTLSRQTEECRAAARAAATSQ